MHFRYTHFFFYKSEGTVRRDKSDLLCRIGNRVKKLDFKIIIKYR